MLRLTHLFLATLNIIALAIPAGAADVRIELADGSSLIAPLQSISTEKIAVKTRTGDRDIPLADVMTISGTSSARPLRSPLRILLTDGSALRGQQCLIDGKKGQITFAQGLPLDLASEAISSIRFREPSAATDTQWNDLLAADATGDRIILRRESEPTENGPPDAPAISLDYRDGTIVAVRPDVVEFDLDGKVLKIKRERLEGIIYLRRNPAINQKLVGKLDDIDGNQWNVAKIAPESTGVAIVTPAGVSRSITISQWRRFDLSEANAKYLSQLDGSITASLLFPLPGLDESEKKIAGPRFDRSFDGALRAGNTTFAHGLHAPVGTTAAYLIPDGYKTFRTIVAVDDRAVPHGGVRITIEADGKVRFREDFGPGKRRMVPVEIDVKDEKRLRISVTSTSGGPLGGQLILAMARFTR
jgi:hypothetical protein